jgi:hypothetical protein
MLGSNQPVMATRGATDRTARLSSLPVGPVPFPEQVEWVIKLRRSGTLQNMHSAVTVVTALTMAAPDEIFKARPSWAPPSRRLAVSTRVPRHRESSTTSPRLARKGTPAVGRSAALDFMDMHIIPGTG